MNKGIEKLTKTEEAILNFLFVHPTTSFRGRALAARLKKPASGIIQSARNLEKRGLVIISKDFVLSIKLNRDTKETFIWKRIYNLKSLYESRLVFDLVDAFPGSTIIVFGSYSYGEDVEDSDIDIAIIGYINSEKEITSEMLEPFEKYLQRDVQLHFFKDTASIQKNLRENIINGIVLEGVIKL